MHGEGLVTVDFSIELALDCRFSSLGTKRLINGFEIP
jgi:hypothetical protein